MPTRVDAHLPNLPSNVEVETGSFINPQGVRLTTFQFGLRDTEHRGVVWLCHGYAAHTIFEWFQPAEPGARHDQWQGSVIQGFVDAGYFVCTLDHQGHGLSEGIDGLKAYVQHFDDLPGESTAYVRDVLLKIPKLYGLPIFLFGISMGGATAVRMAQSNPDFYRGVVLYSPMLSLEQIREKPFCLGLKTKHLLPFAGILNCACPRRALIATVKNTIHPLSQTEFDEDPLTYKGDCRVGTSCAFEQITTRFMAGLLAEMRTPFVTFHCAGDTFTDPLGSRAIFERASTEDKAFVEVGPGKQLDLVMWHALTVEPGHEVVFEHALAWVRERT